MKDTRSPKVLTKWMLGEKRKRKESIVRPCKKRMDDVENLKTLQVLNWFRVVKDIQAWEDVVMQAKCP